MESSSKSTDGMESKFVPTLSNLNDAYINDIENL